VGVIVIGKQEPTSGIPKTRKEFCAFGLTLYKTFRRHGLHSKTDSRIELRVVRLAADGVWLERMMNAKSKNLKGVEEHLMEMTQIR
jgi:hypothetical protein